MEKVISKIISQRLSLDFKKSEKFYEENENEFYLLKRDEKIIPENSSCYIHVNDIDAVFFFCYQKVLGEKIAIKNQLWGMREFYSRRQRQPF